LSWVAGGSASIQVQQEDIPMSSLHEGDLPMPPKPGNFRRGAVALDLADNDPDDELDETDLARLAQLLEALDEQAIRELFDEYLRQKYGGENKG
jgi:hypothetical protein